MKQCKRLGAITLVGVSLACCACGGLEGHPGTCWMAATGAAGPLAGCAGGMGGGAATGGSVSGGAGSSSAGVGGSDDGHCANLAAILTQEDVGKYADCTTLPGIYVHAASDSLSVTLPLLESVSESVYFYHAAQLTQVSLPALESVGKYFYVDGNTMLNSVTTPLLESVGEYFYVSGNPALNSVTTPALSSIGQYLYVVSNQSLSSLDITSLQSVGDDPEGGYVYITNNPALCIGRSQASLEAITTGSVTLNNNATACP